MLNYLASENSQNTSLVPYSLVCRLRPLSSDFLTVLLRYQVTGIRVIMLDICELSGRTKAIGMEPYHSPFSRCETRVT